MTVKREPSNDITAGQADEYHATAGGRVFSWIDGRLGPVGHANLKRMHSTQERISTPRRNDPWTHGTFHGSKVSAPRQETELCDDVFYRCGERPHLSNAPSRRITDERDTGFHWSLRRGGWGRPPVGNPSLGACLPSGFLRQRLSRHPLSARDFRLPPSGIRGQLRANISGEHPLQTQTVAALSQTASLPWRAALL
jgi:hypothetical protein